MRFLLRVSLPLVIGLTGAGCSFILPSQTITTIRHCSPKGAVSFGTSIADERANESYQNSSPSTRAVEVAKVMGVMPLLSQLHQLEQSGATSTMVFLELRQRLIERLLLTLFEVSSTTAEIVCERDRADQIADRMEEIDAGRIKTLTLVSILVSGVAAVVSGGIGLAGGVSTAADATEVAGGVFATSFGGLALFANSKQEFDHGRNLLKEVWDNPKHSAIFSPAIWRYMQRTNKDGTLTAREEVIRAWRQQGRLGEPGSSKEQERIDLFFGSGGIYAATDLRARASMLETLEANIQLLTEELELFLREFIQKQGRSLSQKG